MVSFEDPAKSPEISLVCPVYNEEKLVSVFGNAAFSMAQEEGIQCELIFIDDGSRDATWAQITEMKLKFPQVRGVRLAKNYGKEVALRAGISHAVGHAVIPIDVDFQDPLDLVPKMVELWRQGHKHVIPRRSLRLDSPLRRMGGALFYGSLAWMSNGQVPKNVGDFRLIDADLVKRFLQIRSKRLANKVLFANIGQEAVFVDYVRPGEPKRTGSGQSLGKLFEFFVTTIFSNSIRLSRIFFSIALLSLLLFALVATSVMALWALGIIEVPGQATVILVGSFVVLVNIVTANGLAILLNEILVEAREAPLYFVEESI